MKVTFVDFEGEVCEGILVGDEIICACCDGTFGLDEVTIL